MKKEPTLPSTDGFDTTGKKVRSSTVAARHARGAAMMLAILLVPQVTRADSWPGWRGPTGTGVSPEKGLPLQWGASQNVRWRAELPERGNSSPIVWGNKVLVTQAVSEGKRRTVMCFDRADGKLLWQAGTTYAERESTQRDNPYCTATPVTDGERVIAFFGSAGLYCYDLSAGRELWHRELGRIDHNFGTGASPMLVGDLCVLNFGPDEKARMIAVDKRTGATVWEAQPPPMTAATDSQPAPAAGRGPGVNDGGDRREERGGAGQRAGDDGATASVAASGPLEHPLWGPILAQGDRDGDGKVSPEELAGLAGRWFATLDRDGVGKVERNAFIVRIGELLRSASTTTRTGAVAGAGARRSGGPELFAAADANQDGVLTREEWLAAFARWFAEWDKDRSATLDEAELRAGLSATLPLPALPASPPAPALTASAPGGDRDREGFRPGGGGGFGGRGGGGGGGRGGGSSWSTPVLISAQGREELVVSLPGNLVAYDPKTGRQLWLCKGLGATIYTSPVAGDGDVVAMTSGPGGGNAMAVKAGGNGDVTQSQRLWRLERFKSGIGSGVIYEGYLYTISQEGVAACLDLKTGNTVWEERLRGTGSRGSSWSSLLLADGRIYAPNQAGDVFVLRAAPKYELLATNSVNEPTNASLAASNGEVFLRTDRALWCFGIADGNANSAGHAK